jgi:hypothetical protein
MLALVSGILYFRYFTTVDNPEALTFLGIAWGGSIASAINAIKIQAMVCSSPPPPFFFVIGSALLVFFLHTPSMLACPQC